MNICLRSYLNTLPMNYKLPFLFLVFFFTAQPLWALRLPRTLITKKVEIPFAPIPIEHPRLYCGYDEQGLVGCWKREKYIAWARKNGKLKDETFVANRRNDLMDYQRQLLVVPGLTDQFPSLGEVPLLEATLRQDLSSEAPM